MFFYAVLTGGAPTQVHATAPGNVYRPQLEEKAPLRPQPPRGDAVDDRVHGGEHHVGYEVESGNINLFPICFKTFVVSGLGNNYVLKMKYETSKAMQLYL